MDFVGDEDAVRSCGGHVKIHKIEGKLPVGVSLRVHVHALPGSFGKSLGELFDFDALTRYSSNVPLTFTLDVPEGAEQETAKVLRAMADELAGAKP